MGQTRYPSKIWVFKSRFSFKVRQHGQQQLYLQCKVCWILYKMIGTPSFSQPYLYIQPTPQSPQKTRSSTSVSSHVAITPLLVHKIVPTIPTNNLLLYTFAISHFHLFACNHPNNLQQKYFPISTICKASCRYSCENWFFIPQIQKINILQVWQTIQSTVFHTLNLLSLLPYPTNTITGTQTKNQWLLLIFILSLAFSYTNHGPLHPYVWKKSPFRVE